MNKKVLEKRKKITKEHLGNISRYLGNGIIMGKTKEEMVENVIRSFGYQDWNDYTKDELLELGCGKWGGGGLILLPLLYLKIAKQDVELTSISGSKSLPKNCDCDIRMGFSAYGVVK